MMTESHSNNEVSTLCWVFSILVSCILLLAATGKFFYPSEHLHHIDQWISLFETTLVVILILFRQSRWTWLSLAILGATWGGYAFFWHQLGLPCECLGNLVAIPTPLSLSLDGAFFLIGLFMAYRLHTSKILMGCVCLTAMLASYLGFIVATYVFDKL